MIPNLQELVAVQLILRRRRGRSPQSFRRIAAELNAAGHRTQTGRSWHPSRVREVWEGRTRYLLGSKCGSDKSFDALFRQEIAAFLTLFSPERSRSEMNVITTDLQSFRATQPRGAWSKQSGSDTSPMVHPSCFA
jgi:hypothetical protein